MLSAEGRTILDFERRWWKEPGAKDQAIEMTLGLSAARYYEELLCLLDDPAALAYDPMTVKRVSKLLIEPKEEELAG